MMNEHKPQAQPSSTCLSPLLRPLPQLSPSQPLIRLQTRAPGRLLLLPGRRKAESILPGNSAEARGRICQRPCQLPSSLWPPPSELIPWGLRRLVLRKDRNEGPALGTCGILQLALFRRGIGAGLGPAPAAGGSHLLPPRACPCAHSHMHTHTRQRKSFLSPIQWLPNALLAQESQA